MRHTIYPRGSPFAGGRGLVVVLLLLASAGLFGCEESLAPREHFEMPFTIYGVLSPDLDTQSVRLYVPEDFPTLGAPEPLDVDVTSTDLHTGERWAWRDTVLVEPNGQHEYVFWSTFRAAFDRTYRVEVVRRSDGVTSHAEVRIPPPVTVRIDDQGDALLEVYIEGEDFRALKPEAVYGVDKGGGPSCPLVRFPISYEERERRVEQGWLVTFNMVVDQDHILYRYNGVMYDGVTFCAGRCPSLNLRELELHVLVGDAVWDPPGGVFEAHILAQPQALDNVENGFGFIGGGYRIVEPLFPSREAVEDACFTYVWD